MVPQFQQRTEHFKTLARTQKLSHAYLFFGGGRIAEALSEKIRFARSLANFLETNKFDDPQTILNELLIVEKRENKAIGIDSVRQLRNFLYRKPVTSSYRTAIIKDADALTPEAQHAALKIVEEPPLSALMIFIVASPDNLLPTLASRLQKIYFPLTASGQSTKVTGFTISDIDEIIEGDIDQWFEELISRLERDRVKNAFALKEALKRLTYIKQFNTNKRLQLRCLIEKLKQEV